MHRPCTSTSNLPLGSGMVAASADASSVRGWPRWRSRMAIASGLPVSTRWSPSTPFSAASKASRRRELGAWLRGTLIERLIELLIELFIDHLSAPARCVIRASPATASSVRRARPRPSAGLNRVMVFIAARAPAGVLERIGIPLPVTMRHTGPAVCASTYPVQNAAGRDARHNAGLIFLFAFVHRNLRAFRRQFFRVDTFYAANIFRDFHCQCLLCTAVNFAGQGDNTVLGIHLDIGSIDV